VPVGKCIDYLATRGDVDMSRIAVCGSSLGGYYAARAGSYEHRLAACILHGAIWDIGERWKTRSDDHPFAGQITWVFGAKNMAQAAEIARPFKLAGALENMKCPYLIIHGGHDILGVEAVQAAYDYAKSKNIDVALRLTSEEETGADHCQHDNPTLGQELMIDWLAGRFKIDQRSLTKSAMNPLV
jgi:dienelactone hydrolase